MKPLLVLLAVASALVALATVVYVRNGRREYRLREWPDDWFTNARQGGHAITATWTNSPAWERGEVSYGGARFHTDSGETIAEFVADPNGNMTLSWNASGEYVVAIHDDGRDHV